MNRRDYLRAVGILSVTGVSTLAGCTAQAESNSPPSQPSDPTLPSEPVYDDWFKGVSNYQGTIDRRGESTVTVAVGAPGNMGAFGFGPAAVAVSPSTAVIWEWTGRGGGHNVVAVDGSFDSGSLVDSSGHTFTHRFDEPGVYKYVCDPHRSIGMRGAVVVMEGTHGT